MTTFVWHIDRAKFEIEDAEEYARWKETKTIVFEMDPSSSDDGGTSICEDPDEAYCEFELSEGNSTVSIEMGEGGPTISAWVKWNPKLADDVTAEEVLEWGTDQGGWYAGTIALADVDAEITEDDGGDLRVLAQDA